MSRRLTGWVLTAAMIAALPAPALSSNDPINNLGRDFRPTVTPLGSTQLLRDGMGSLAGDDNDHTDCLEVMTPREFTVLHGGKLLVVQRPYPKSNANGADRFDRGMAGDADEQLLGIIDPGKHFSSGQAMLPEGKVRPDHVRAACGIPGGLTLLAPVVRELRPAAGATP